MSKTKHQWRITSLPDINGVELVADIEAETILTDETNKTFAFYNGKEPIAFVRADNLYSIYRIDAILDDYDTDSHALDAETIEREQ